MSSVLSAPVESQASAACACKARGPVTSVTPYRTITREQFLLRETRICARLLVDDGCTPETAERRVVTENLFQYPTERMTGNLARICLWRLDNLNNPQLIALLAHGTSEQASQTNLYAMARTYRLVYEFLVRVVGEKLATLDGSLTRADISMFLAELQQSSETVASWSDLTIDKCRQVLTRALAEAGYLASTRSTQLQRILPEPELEQAIRANGDESLLPAFGAGV